MQMTERLVAHFEESEHATQALGGMWYRESRRVARQLSRKHGTTLATAAGVIAALSPRMRWSSNVALADAMLGGEEVSGVFEANLNKARRIIAGEYPLRVLGGPKVRAFYRAIMGDEDAVVVDVWMYRAAGIDPKKATVKDYERVATAIREAAFEMGLPAATFQAIVWTQVRGGAT